MISKTKRPDPEVRHDSPRTRGAPRAFLGATLAVFAACSVSQQQEVDIGENYSAQIAQQLPLLKDPEAVQYINVLGDSLAKVTDERNLEWHFSIVDSREVNAFAVPGGWIYVNRGLIERAQNLAQVAGVLGHEIGHVTKRHSIKQMQKAQGANVGVSLACILTRICDSGLGQAAIQIGGGAVFAKFSREDESEADAEGVRTLVRAGINPRGMPEMFRILLDERKDRPGGVEAWFLTHPLEEDRITATNGVIAKYAADQLGGLTNDSPRFQAFRRHLISLPPSPPARKAESERRVRGEGEGEIRA